MGTTWQRTDLETTRATVRGRCFGCKRNYTGKQEVMVGVTGMWMRCPTCLDLIGLTTTTSRPGEYVPESLHSF